MAESTNNPISNSPATGVSRFLRRGPRFWLVLALGLAVVGSAVLVLARLVSPLPVGSIPGVSLELQPASEVMVGAETVTVTVFLDSVGDDGSVNDVVAVAAYLTFDDTRFSVSNFQINALWSTAGPSNGVSGNQIEIVVGGPSPGLSGEQVVVATFDLTAVVGAPKGKGSLVFDGARSAVILDDGQGTNILNQVFDGEYFVGSVGLGSCSELGGDICAPDESCQTQELVDDDPNTVCCETGGCGPVQGVVRITGGPSAAVECAAPKDSDPLPNTAVAWSTNVAADGQLAWASESCPTCTWQEFLDKGATQISAPGPSDTLHQIEADNLPDDASLFFRVRSASGGLAAAVSREQSIFTGCGDDLETPFRITNLTVEPKPRSAVVSWNTTLLADSEIFGLDPPNSQGTDPFTNTTITLSHSLRVPGLEPNTRYCLRVRSKEPGVIDCSAEPQRCDIEPDMNSEPRCFFTENENLAFNANTVLRVDRDRICGAWLSCESAVDLLGIGGKPQPPLCFDRALCNELDPSSGVCVNFVRAAQVNQTFTQFGPGLDRSTQTVDELALFSGHAQVGLAFVGFAGAGSGFQDGVIEGLFPYAAQSQVGSSLSVPNGDFETAQPFPWRPRFSKDVDASRVASLTVRPDTSGFFKDFRHVLEIGPKPRAEEVSGAVVPLGRTLHTQAQYYVTFDARTGSQKIKQIIVQFGFRDYARFRLPYASDVVPVTQEWQHITVGPFEIRPEDLPGQGEQTYLGFLFQTTEASAPFGSFFIDNVRIEPVLQVSSGKQVASSCRLYPSSDAPSCNFFDLDSGRQLQGWAGYCVLPDPANTSRCIQWRPVDITSGSNAILSSRSLAGYNNRIPLYYCSQARGNAPYERSVPTDSVISSNQAAKCDDARRGIDKKGKRDKARFIKCLSGNNGWENYSGLLRFDQTNPDSLSVLRTTDGAPLSNFKEWEIEQVQVVVANASHQDWPQGEGFSLNQANDWDMASCSGAACDEDLGSIYTRSGSSFYWQHIVASGQESADGSRKGCGAPFGRGGADANLFGVKFEFDPQGNLTEVKAGLCDASDGHGWLELEFIVYLREWCTQVAQAVDPLGGNTAWARTVANEERLVSGLGYGFDDDLEPFGAIVPPPPDFDPGRWDGIEGIGREPLFVEPPNKQLFPTKPHQARAGFPYGVSTRLAQIPGGSGTCILSGGVCQSPAACPTNVQDACQLTGLDGLGTCLLSGGICGGANDIKCPIVDDRCELPPGSRTCTEGRVGTACTFNEDCEIFMSGTCFEQGGLTGVCEAGGPAAGQACNPNDPNACSGFFGRCGDGIDPARSVLSSAICVSGRKLGADCARHSDCGADLAGNLGRCTGVVAPSGALDEDDFFRSLNNSNGSSILASLFARSQAVWEWDFRESRYVSGLNKFDFARGCSAPGLCSKTGAGWDITGDVDSQGRPVHAVLPVATSTTLTVQNVTYSNDNLPTTGPGWCVGGPFDGQACQLELLETCPAGGRCLPIVTFRDGFGTASLSFNSIVSSEQEPLVRYTVDWGDGKVSEEAGLRIAGQPALPHVLSHTYTEPRGGKPYIPRVQIEDNWGWCSGVLAEPTAICAGGDKAGLECPPGDHASCGGGGRCVMTNYAGAGITCTSWDAAPVAILVEEPQPSGNLRPIAAAGPDATIADSDGDGFEFVGLNASGSFDPDGTIVSYVWSEGGTVLTTNEIALVELPVGTHIISLTVTDDQGATGTDLKTVVVEASPDAPIINSLAWSKPNPVVGGENIFTINASDLSGDTTLDLALDFGEGTVNQTINVDTDTDIKVIWNTPGEYLVTATVANSRGLSASQNMTVNIAGAR